jgi:hypothetical protein
MQSNSKTAAIVTGAVGSVIATVVATWMGIGATVAPGVTIDGPTLTAVESVIRLTGHVNGDHQHAYWTDELGQTVEMYGAEGPLDWYCLGPGRFSVSLIAVMEDGSKYQDTHEIECL